MTSDVASIETPSMTIVESRAEKILNMPTDIKINDAAHAGRALRTLALPNISVFIRAIIASLPASFWVSVLQLVIRLMPYLTTKAMNNPMMSVTPSQVEDAIVKSE